LDVGFFDFSFGNLNGTRGEVKTRCLPACFGEGDDVCACAAANIEGATRGVGLDEFEEFGWGDAAVPGRRAKVTQVELKARQTSLPCASKKMKVGVNSKP